MARRAVAVLRGILVGTGGTLSLVLAVLVALYFRPLELAQVAREQDVGALLRARFGRANVAAHEVETADGYLLGLFHIRSRSRRRRGGGGGGGGGASHALLLHGLADSAATWVQGHAAASAAACAGGGERGAAAATACPKSLVSQLLDAGVDVWLGQARGRPPFRHRTLSPEHPAYWDFSYDELIAQDAPALIRAAARGAAAAAAAAAAGGSGGDGGDGGGGGSGGKARLALVGHSQGALALLAAVATDQELARAPAPGVSVRAAVVLSCPHLELGGEPLGPTAAATVAPPERHPTPVLLRRLGAALGPGPSPLRVWWALHTFIRHACALLPAVCSHCICAAAGCASAANFAPRAVVVPQIFAFYPAPDSWRSALHFGQVRASGRWRRWWRCDGNGTAPPDAYRWDGLAAAGMRISAFYGGRDRMNPTTLAGAARTLARIASAGTSTGTGTGTGGSTVGDTGSFPSYGHADLVWGTGASSELFPRVVTAVLRGSGDERNESTLSCAAAAPQ
jgi:hypothetical protein